MLKRSILPSEINLVLSFLSKHQITFFITGGFTRDYLLNKSFSKDVDIEVQFLPLKLQEKIEKEWSLSVKILPYDILSFSLGDYKFELQAPRTEKYKKQNSYDHHDFEVSIDPSLKPSDSFKRRDFTINAMALTFSREKQEDLVLLDPYEGLKDLQNKKLRTVNPNFFLDPVRFLRLVRFKSNFNFSYDEDLLLLLKNFELSKLSSHYLIKEFLAAKDKQGFIEEIQVLQKNYHLNLKHLKREIEELILIAATRFSFNSEAEFFAKICEGEEETSHLSTQNVFLKVGKHFKSITAWKVVKKLLDSQEKTLSSAELQALASWERFCSTDFFTEISAFFKTDEKLLNSFLLLLKLKLEQNELKILATLPNEERSHYSWSQRLVRLHK